jgi:hypothetical protein
VAFVVFAGQSNALGWGMSAETLPLQFSQLDWGTFIWNNEAAGWELMMPGLNTGTPKNPQAWGPEVAFARAFREANPFEPLFIVKSVKGSTGLAEDPHRLDWSPNSEGELFDLTAERIQAARESLWGLEVDAVFIVQGEQDAFFADMASAYADNMSQWLAAIRAEWMGDADGQIAFARIADTTPHNDAVQMAQLAVDEADARAWSFDTAEFQLQDGDQLHFAAEGYLQIGRSFYSLYDDWA